MTVDPYKILLVDDEEDIIEFLTYNLEKAGFQVFAAFNGKEAIEKATALNPHLILMDVMMPVMDGIEAVKQIRKNQQLNNTLIVFLTARGEDYSQIAGFESGADDYVTKPIKPNVLIKRLEAILRRSKKNSTTVPIIDLHNMRIDATAHVVEKGGKKYYLPKKEFGLLYLLASQPNKVFRRSEIFHEIWGEDVVVGERTIDVHIRKIREKLEIKNIKTVKGIGYKFEV
jgi:two-component system alkaline phosphatase synthesis response regulator PhoP